MRKTIEFSVPVPCHENWNSMTPNEQGRYCLSCQKSVVDFTSMSNLELILFFKHRSDNTCGRFRSDQLNKELLLEQPRKLNWYKYVLQILIPTMLFAAKGYAQGKVRISKNVNKVAAIEKEPRTMGTPAVMVLGDTTSCVKPIMEKPTVAIIQPKRITTKKISNKTIEFTVPIRAINSIQPITISDHPLNNRNEHMDMNKGELWPSNYPVCVVAGGISIRRSKVSTAQKIKKLAKDSLKVMFNKPAIEQMKVYPNPLLTSSSMNIEYRTQVDGEYTIAIIDMSGVTIQRDRIFVQSKLLRQQVRLNHSFAAGTYVLQLFDPNGKALTFQKIVVAD